MTADVTRDIAPGTGGAQAARDARLWPWVALGTAVLMVPALINGAPFIYYDSAVYLRRPEPVLHVLLYLLAPLFDPLPAGPGGVAGMTERLGALSGADPGRVVWIAYSGRSVPYRMLGWLAAEYGRVWPLVLAQAGLTSLTAALVWTRVAGLRPGWVWLGGIAALSALTPLGLFAGMVMPDILSGLVVLAVAALMLGWSDLRGSERAALAAVACFAMLAHQSHLLLGMGLALCLLVAGMIGTGRSPARGTAFAVVTTAALTALVSVQLPGWLHDLKPEVTVLTRPHLVAHLVDDGPGVGFLRRTCPEAGFAMCAHVDHLPVRWNQVLFGGPTPQTRFLVDAPIAQRIAVSREQIPFVIAVLRDDAAAVMAFALRAAGRQLVAFSPEGSVIPPVNLATFEVPFPPYLKQATWESALFANFGILHGWGRVTQLTVLASLGLLGLGVVLVRRQRDRPPDGGRLIALVVAILAGVVLNAVVCGVLAAPYDRFQARIVWLVPYSALILAAAVVWPRRLRG